MATVEQAITESLISIMRTGNVDVVYNKSDVTKY